MLASNGSGKTTLVKVLVGLLDPQEGSVRIEGETYANSLERICTNGSASSCKTPRISSLLPPLRKTSLTVQGISASPNRRSSKELPRRWNVWQQRSFAAARSIT